MSQHGTDQILQVGYLRSCMDRRFVQVTRDKFEEVTGLTNDRYYHEAFAGGVLNTAFPVEFPQNSPPTPDGADYVYNNQDILLEVMGWQAHLDHCGGLKGVPDDKLEARFQELVNSGLIQKSTLGSDMCSCWLTRMRITSLKSRSSSQRVPSCNIALL